jgi:peptide-methionine (R)-S-oxide reductase
MSQETNVKRRNVLATLLGAAVLPVVESSSAQELPQRGAKIEKITKTDDEWRKLLSPSAYKVLRQEGTERSGTSPLSEEKRKGTYLCAGCDLPVFTSEMKYDSGTGWPSFFDSLPGVFETKKDWKLLHPRTEYHCARCGGHHGHLFDDGPKPTGQRWCNNGLALKFVPA